MLSKFSPHRRAVHRQYTTLLFLAVALVPLIGCSRSPYGDETTYEEIIDDTDNTDMRERAMAYAELGRRTTKPDVAIPILIEGLADESKTVRYRAMSSLQVYGEKALRPLIVATKAPDSMTRFYAAHTLKKMPFPQAQEAHKKYMEVEGHKYDKGF
ncbi:MAG: hypothetical protein Q8R76_04520 [Candidatus Omnitrophota bacterium]|nr:hypothetical protein [Candidatus Omnitrophota bacterium]